MKVLLLNAPPRSGKDTLARMIAEKIPDRCAVIGFAHHLKRMVHGVYLGREGWDLDPNYFDAVKEQPQEILTGMSWRQAYIHYSEFVIKPLHGKEWFGEQFMRAARATKKDLIIVPDSGFAEEAARVIREVGHKNVRLVQLYREGCDYTGDSRSYIDLFSWGVRNVNVRNEQGDPSKMFDRVYEIVKEMFAVDYEAQFSR